MDVDGGGGGEVQEEPEKKRERKVYCTTLFYSYHPLPCHCLDGEGGGGSVCTTWGPHLAFAKALLYTARMPSVEASMLHALSKAKVPLFLLPGASVRRQKISLSNLPQVRKKPTRWIFRCMQCCSRHFTHINCSCPLAQGFSPSGGIVCSGEGSTIV